MSTLGTLGTRVLLFLPPLARRLRGSALPGPCSFRSAAGHARPLLDAVDAAASGAMRTKALRNVGCHHTSLSNCQSGTAAISIEFDAASSPHSCRGPAHNWWIDRPSSLCTDKSSPNCQNLALTLNSLSTCAALNHAHEALAYEYETSISIIRLSSLQSRLSERDIRTATSSVRGFLNQMSIGDHKHISLLTSFPKRRWSICTFASRLHCLFSCCRVLAPDRRRSPSAHGTAELVPVRYNSKVEVPASAL